MSTEQTPRVHIIFGMFFLCALVLIGRLFFVQIVQGKQFAADADNQYTTRSPNTLNRGNIFFKERDGMLVSAATLKAGYTIAIDPGRLSDPKMLSKDFERHRH
jgi:cell division protein FtsI/penicillin-binding protein 2